MNSKTIVQKYGGTSVATPAKLRIVAERVQQTQQSGLHVVVVVSAMGDTTDRLVELAHELAPSPKSREMDMLLATGEMVTAPLLAMTLQSIGVNAKSLTGLQAGITTSGSHRKARIRAIVPRRILEALYDNIVPVVAGFQGVTEELDITTLGRGGSDTSAVALAVAVGAERCEIYTDVAGVFTADPRVAKDAKALNAITYEEMLELASRGASVLHPRAVEIGEAYEMPIWVRSTFNNSPGTLICRTPPEAEMEERQTVRGIASQTDVAKLTVRGVPDSPGVAAKVFAAFAEHQISVDVVVQNVSHDGTTDMSFTIAQPEIVQAKSVLEQVASSVGATGFDTNTNVGQVSVVGTGMRSTPGVVAKAFKALADADINIDMISTGEIYITCIIAEGQVNKAVRALHRAFELDQI